MCVDVDVDEVEWKKRENKRRWMGPLEEIKRQLIVTSFDIVNYSYN
jgi:hypothetical protein